MTANRDNSMQRRIVAFAAALIMAAVMLIGAAPQQAGAAEQVTVGKTSSIYRYKMRTKTKAYIAWNKVSGATGYYVYRYKSGSYKKIATTSKRYVYQTGLSRTNYFRVIAYKKVNGTIYKGTAVTRKVTMPSVITPSSSGYTSTYGYKIIKKGRTKLGCRYVWGASGPSRFDCSGFTWWTMRNSGVSGVKFTRTSSQSLYNRYKSYSIGTKLSKAQSGDILLFGYSKSKKRIYHVGIYYSKGRYIHANGTKVTISKVYTSNLVSIIRFKGLR